MTAKSRPRKSAYQRGRIQFKRSAVLFALLFVLVLVPCQIGLFVAVFLSKPVLGSDLLFTIMGVTLVFLAAIVAYGCLRLAVLRMEQAEEHRADDLVLANAMEELTKELHRRPQVSSSTTFALFASDEQRKRD